MHKQFIFDFDYTLVDSSPGIIKCFRLLFENHGITDVSDEQIKRTIGKTIEDAFTELMGVTDKDELLSLRKEYRDYGENHMNANTTLFADAKRILERLRAADFPYGVFSLKYRYRIDLFFNDYFPDLYPDVIVGGEDVTMPKPNPEGLHKAIELLGNKKSETLYVGDSYVDALTAQNGKIDFIGITHGTTTAEELKKYKNEHVISSFDEMMNLYEHDL